MKAEALTLEWIEEQLALCARATPGPWKTSIFPGAPVWEIAQEGQGSATQGKVIAYTEGCYLPAEEQANAELIVAAGTHYAAVLQMLKEVLKRLEIVMAERNAAYDRFNDCLGDLTDAKERMEELREAPP